MTIQVYNAIPVEAIRKGNAEHKQIMPNRDFNKLLLGKGIKKYQMETPSEIRGARPWYTGTGFAFEALGKAFGDKIEKEFRNWDANKKQTLIYYVRKEDIGARNLMHLFEHQFRGDESTIQLINAKTNKEIFTVGELRNADEIILKVVGPIYSFRLNNRNDGVFETVGEENTTIRATEDSAIGLLVRGDYNSDCDFGKLVYADLNLGYKHGVVYTTPQAASANLAEMQRDAENAMQTLESMARGRIPMATDAELDNLFQRVNSFHLAIKVSFPSLFPCPEA
jgi:hypothetical protein